MSDRPLSLGINRTQDASICLTDGQRILCAIQKERLTRHKHHWGRVDDLRRIYAPRLADLDARLDVIVECFSSDAELRKLDDYEREIAAVLAPAPTCRRARISHHLAHLYSAFHPSPFESAAVMVIDGQGSAVRDFTDPTERGVGADAPGHWLEVASFYRADRRRVECLAKQLWDRDDRALVGLGMFYFLLTQAIFPGEGNEGKVMGLAPHGDPAALRLPPLEVRGAQVFIPPAWVEILHQGDRFRWIEEAGRGANGGSSSPAGPDAAGIAGCSGVAGIGTAGAGIASGVGGVGGVGGLGGLGGAGVALPASRFRDIANLAAAGQRAFEDALIALARWLHDQTGADHLCFAGGTALNCSANGRLMRETPFRSLFIPPAPGDAGTALGCALYGVQAVLGRATGVRWVRDDLGPLPSVAHLEAVLRGLDDCVVERLDERGALAARLVDLLCDRQVLALCQGRSEFGPRALGQRSILADPRRAEMRDWINAKIKRREWFRPLAPVVLAEHAAEYFELDRPSPFMQFAVAVRPAAAARIPAVTHVDGSARLQTIPTRDTGLLRALLEGFATRTGVPVLLNTSFNRREEPIVETPEQALATFRATPLHALVLPPFLVTKREAPPAVR